MSASESKDFPLSHGPDWEAVHQRLVADAEVWNQLPLHGVVTDADGGLRVQRGCPFCGSTISGPQITKASVSTVLSEHARVLYVSLAMVAEHELSPCQGSGC